MDLKKKITGGKKAGTEVDTIKLMCKIVPAMNWLSVKEN